MVKMLTAVSRLGRIALSAGASALFATVANAQSCLPTLGAWAEPGVKNVYVCAYFSYQVYVKDQDTTVNNVVFADPSIWLDYLLYSMTSGSVTCTGGPDQNGLNTFLVAGYAQGNPGDYTDQFSGRDVEGNGELLAYQDQNNPRFSKVVHVTLPPPPPPPGGG